MYRRPKFLEVLLEIRREMAREADYDVNLLVETARAGKIGQSRRGTTDAVGERDARTTDRPRAKRVRLAKPDKTKVR